MTYRVRTTLLCVALVASPFSAMASSLVLVAGAAYSGYTGGSYTPYQNGQGGEFVALDTTSGLPVSWVPSGYDSKATYKFPTGSLTGLTGFDTFCVEGGSNDIYYTPGVSYSYTESEQILGGPMGTLDLSQGAAWLYANFAKGSLSGYHYTSAARLGDAGALQSALWFLEGEISDPNNVFSNLAISHFGLADALKSVNSSGASNFDVSVLNLRGPAQNQLIYNGRKVPDAGSTLALLGLALGGLVAVRRKMQVR